MIFVAVVVVSIIALLVYSYFRDSDKSRPPFLPGRLPLLGNLSYIQNDINHFHESNIRYGKEFNPIFRTNILGETWTVVTDYEDVKKILLTEGELFSARPVGTAIAQIVVYDNYRGIVESSGEEWKEQRRFALQTLRNMGFGKSIMQDKILFETKKTTDALEKIAANSGNSIEPKTHLRYLIGAIISSVIMGKVFDLGDKRFIEISDTLEKVMDGMLNPFLRWNSVIMQRFPGDLFGLGEWKRHKDELDGFFESIIDEKQREFEPDSEPADFVTAYLAELHRRNETGEMGTFCKKQLMAALADLWIAGLETTIHSLNFAILYMIRNPDIQERVHKEVRDNLSSGEIRMEDSKNTPYTNAVLSEVQRIGNVADLTLLHTPTHPTELRGYTIKPGDLLMPSIYGSHMNPDFFPEPYEFKPERFLESDGKTAKKYDTFFPFGMGKRVCMGEGLAKMEMYIVFATLMFMFKFSAVDPDNLPTTEAHRGFTLQPKPYRCHVELR